MMTDSRFKNPATPQATAVSIPATPADHRALLDQLKPIAEQVLFDIFPMADLRSSTLARDVKLLHVKDADRFIGEGTEGPTLFKMPVARIKHKLSEAGDAAAITVPRLSHKVGMGESGLNIFIVYGDRAFASTYFLSLITIHEYFHAYQLGSGFLHRNSTFRSFGLRRSSKNTALIGEIYAHKEGLHTMLSGVMQRSLDNQLANDPRNELLQTITSSFREDRQRLLQEQTMKLVDYILALPPANRAYVFKRHLSRRVQEFLLERSSIAKMMPGIS
ncbi:hypothetical protein ACFL37_02185 [Candidatus Margulisiibacteriota bacterium]